MKTFIHSGLLLLLAFIPCASAESLLLVANTSGKEVHLTREEVRNLYMGAPLSQKLTPIALPPRHPLRSLFNTRVVGLAESRIQSYWAQMRFTGRKQPPKELEGEEQLLHYLSETPGAVGYVSASSELPATLTVIYQLH